MVSTKAIHWVDDRRFATELKDRYDTETALCGLVHWPEASIFNYTDRTTDRTQVTCKRCLYLMEKK